MPLCRVCAIPADDSTMFRLFDDAEGPLELAEIFLQVSGIAIQVGDSKLPKCCCQRCRNRLQEVEDLKALCQESDRKLRKMIGITVKEEEESEELYGNDGRAIPKVEMLELDESYSHWDDMGNQLDFDDGRSECDDDDKPFDFLQNKRDETNMATIGISENVEKYYFSDDSKDGDPDFTAEKTSQNTGRKKKEDLKKRGRKSKIQDPAQEAQPKVLKKRGRKPKIRDPNADPKEEKQRKKASESLCCTACGKVYKSLFALREHETTHTLEKRFKCEICGMEFGKRTIFILHGFSTQFKCSECEKAFHTEKLLNQHIQIRHRGERPFHCKLCPKTYPRASSLYVHVQTFHEKIRKKIYKCDICTRSFVNRHGYERHMNSHQGLKLNQCPHCGNKYEFRAYLLQHIAEKHPEMVPNLTRCEYCGVGYSTDGYYRKHIVKRHPEHLTLFDQLMKAKREAILAGMPSTTVTSQETGGSFS
ncbi:conserved hypothetical protein [Culex quinquefasciatus]|uniref:Uncharacterized protein n=1 Tax=Culex quinquefasciatus TaxID=7176 RepID=B0X6G1_CULQU|nr:conserved hypothetical protein [Culex quinquefasciatus]|eukprot:XP_001865233.1 conserved hypothetical protein [Culex quinquefasciatus]